MCTVVFSFSLPFIHSLSKLYYLFRSVGWFRSFVRCSVCFYPSCAYVCIQISAGASFKSDSSNYEYREQYTALHEKCTIETLSCRFLNHPFLHISPCGSFHNACVYGRERETEKESKMKSTWSFFYLV